MDCEQCDGTGVVHFALLCPAWPPRRESRARQVMAVPCPVCECTGRLFELGVAG